MVPLPLFPLLLLLFLLPLTFSQPCPPGTYSNPIPNLSPSCLPCPPGTFNPHSNGQGRDVCRPCPPQTFNPTSSATSPSMCLPCPSGTTSSPGANQCITCPAGQVVRSCTPGAEYKSGICARRDDFGDTTITTVQVNCQVCRGNTAASTDGMECVSCRDPERNIGGVCRTCPGGTGGSISVRGSVGACRRCTRYRVNDGRLGYCAMCEAGFEGDAERGGQRCVPCGRGKFRSEGMEGGCRDCGAGENSRVRGGTVCVRDGSECAGNFFRGRRGGCETCTRMERYDVGRRRCVMCGRNEVSRGGVDTVCRRCGVGMVGTEGGCACREGWEGVEGGCRRCEKGFAKGVVGGGLCGRCDFELFAGRRGMRECGRCPMMRPPELFGRTVCPVVNRCPRGLVVGVGGRECVDGGSNCPPEFPVRAVGEDGALERCEAVGVATCPAGMVVEEVFFDAVNSVRSCVPCVPPGRIERGVCVQRRVRCGRGFRAVRSLGRCVCDGNREIVDGRCVDCGEGRVSNKGLMGVCETCAAGTFQDGADCVKCPPGSVSEEGSVRCTACPRGTTTFGQGESTCVAVVV